MGPSFDISCELYYSPVIPTLGMFTPGWLGNADSAIIPQAITHCVVTRVITTLLSGSHTARPHR